MVPGLGYRVLREVLKRTTRIALPLEPRGPRWWEAGWTRLRERLRPRRWALLSVLRGIVNPITDARMERDAELRRLVAQFDARGGEEQPTTA